ncbi:MAG: heterodisulfide reductase-related iron-sulfur binding cluster, partial [Candidatus Hermodarchaeota archaeon]
FIGGIDYYCNFVYHHYGRLSITKERASKIHEKIKKQGIKEMICFHDECYQLFTKHFPQYNLEVDFKVIPLYEYLYNYLKNHEPEITKLNMKIAYQRPCSSRFIPEIDDWVDKICDLIGVNRVPRKFDRQNGLCCSGVFTLIGKKKMMRKAQSDNIEDMIDHGAEACVYNCPMCMAALGYKVEKNGLKNYILSDLCKLALGENV